MNLLKCLVFMAVSGALCFPLGRLLAKLEYNTDAGLLSPLPFEKNGKIYDKLQIRKWQTKVPDVSRVFPGIVPRKALEESCTAAQAKILIKETCVAEISHWILCVTGIAIPFLWRGIGGLLLYLLYVILGNLPFILIQRYNRPRLSRLSKLLEKREARGAGSNPAYVQSSPERGTQK